jgi:O-antigen/teichoic acid export membrane protein
LSSIENGNSYIKYVAGILAFDAISAIPFAKLRQENKAKRFAILRLINIGINIGLNLFFLVLCPALLKTDSSSWVNVFYNPEIGIGYVFISNLIASAATVLLLSPEIFSSKFEFDTALWKNMIIYSFPLMIAGFAGMINETIDRILIPYLINDKTDAMVQLGIYGACYKLSIIMTLFIQTFRYAAEPFFFSQSTGEQPQKVYAEVMNYFVIVCSFIFLSVMLYIDVVKLFIGPAYRSGLVVVPILLMANLCLGVFYNLSIWYKLTAKTTWGAWISILGAIITLALNFWLIPVMGYLGAAWATLICYASMMVISYSFGQKYYHVPYKVFSFFRYTILALVLWLVSRFFENNYTLSSTSKFLIHTALLLVFVFITWIYERGKINYLRSRK